jgi:DNA-binding NarL/FixJ family response regulator
LTTQSKRIKVVIADDQAMFLEALKMMLENFEFIEITGMAVDGHGVLDLVVKEKPDVIVTDIQMPAMNGIELTKELQECYPEIKMIALTAHGEDHYIVDMLEAGAKGFLTKNAGKEKLAEAIFTVYNNAYYYCEETELKVIQKIAASKVKATSTEDPNILTETEQKIVRLICMEYSSKEIAKELFIGEKTVENYRNKIYDKVGVKNMAGIVVFGVRSGLVKI